VQRFSRAVRSGLCGVAVLASAGRIDGAAAGPASAPPGDPAAAPRSGPLRTVAGRRLRLVTDVPADSEVDALPQAFDAAVPLWADYFQTPPAAWSGWRVDAHLIARRAVFEAAGRLPAENPRFVNGFARADALWWDEQESAYYRRHLLLHEGTHAFMHAFLGGAGPGWYMEGMAERLATHVWAEGKLRLAQTPATRDDAPLWGRIKLIRDACREGRAWSLEQVLAIDNRRVLNAEAYAWSWALVSLLDEHPDRRPVLRGLAAHVREPAAAFNRRFRREIGGAWGDLEAEWQAFIADLDYGYDYGRQQLVHRAAAPWTPSSGAVEIEAARGWQSTGWLLRGGATYRFAAAGRFSVAADPEPWMSEADGVTLAYHGGAPLGMLLGALRPRDDEPSATGSRPPAPDLPDFLRPCRLGASATLRPAVDGVLYVKINDAAARRNDNAGGLTLRGEAVESRD